MDEKSESIPNETTVEKSNSSKKSPDNNEQRTSDRKRRDRSRSSSSKRHRRSRSRSTSRRRHHHHHHHHHHRRHHHDEKRRRRSRSRSRSPRRKRSHSNSPRRRPSPVKPVQQRPTPQIDYRSQEEERKRIQLENLQKLRDMAANDTLDISQLTIDELKKSIDVPKEIRTNQAAVITYQMEEIRKLVEELSGITIPKIYNNGAVNPLQYAQQQKKRKLLWSKTNDKTSTSRVGAAITDSQDEKNAEKFRKLLGMKSGSQSANDSGETNAINQQQQNTFDCLDKEYQTARITTHLRRGVGLGFLSQGPFIPSTSEKN